MPGQTVEIREKVLYVDGAPVEDPTLTKHTDHRLYSASEGSRDNFGPHAVEPGHFFLLGDNRDNSNDSRSFGTVPRELIKGKAMVVYWSATLVPGNLVWNLPTLPGRTRYARLGTAIH